MFCIFRKFFVKHLKLLSINCLHLWYCSGYLIVSPQKIRPDQDFRLFVTIYKMYHHECDVRAVLSSDAVEYATETVTFTHTGTKQMILKVFMTADLYRPQGEVMFSQVSVCPQSASCLLLVHWTALLQHNSMHPTGMLSCFISFHSGMSLDHWWMGSVVWWNVILLNTAHCVRASNWPPIRRCKISWKLMVILQENSDVLKGLLLKVSDAGILGSTQDAFLYFSYFFHLNLCPPHVPTLPKLCKWFR